MPSLSDLRLSKNMKYTALYVAMRFFEHMPEIYEKEYFDGTYIKIDSSNQSVYINGEFVFELDTHESFVKLECINRLLTLGYSLTDFNLLNDVINFKGYKIKFIVWDDEFTTNLSSYSAIYKSRLVSGVLEYKTLIFENDYYDYGLFENKSEIVFLSKKQHIEYDNPDFIIEENRLIRYIGKDKIVSVPYGIDEIESSAFWDNQYIEYVNLPETVLNLGGDTFYNCKNLRKVNIPKSVILMGNNPFAGCPFVEIDNQSPNFLYEDGVLYTADKTTLIYCSIKGDGTEFVIPEGVIIISKHAFYLCDRFEKITLPKSLEKMENNPFSGCSKLELINKSNAYFIKDDVIYNGFKTAAVGTLNRIQSKRLELIEGIKTINRNSFWNCKGIDLIVFPSSLEDIGYNPFVGCSNIHFESHSPYYRVVDGVLYNKDLSKIVCYPAWKAVGEIHLLDSVLTLERGAFSGCSKMTKLNLHNVNIINKSCFTNCSSLIDLYCSDYITYIGEWAFAYCTSLQNVSVYKDTIIDSNAFSNTNCDLIIRKELSNYLIESDNIFSLKSFQRFYKNKIDSILIDPPYNSHIDYIEYKDGDYDNGYYSFMYDRIKLSYNLLSDNGFLIVNIDEGELETLSNLCGDIFSKENILICKWKKLHEFFDKNRNVNPNKKVVLYEYIIVCKKSNNSKLGMINQPYIVGNVLEEYMTDFPTVFDCFGTTSSAKDEIAMLFGDRAYFSTPKPIKLMKELIRSSTKEDSIVLDYFAGSGTVGQACLELNRESNSNRTFILVCNNESNICKKVALQRINKVIKDDEDFMFLD